MDLTIIAAVSENDIIGINGSLPWRIKEDIKRFKEITLNHPIIMGRNTYKSIPEKFRPLTDRKNIIFHPEGSFFLSFREDLPVKNVTEWRSA